MEMLLWLLLAGVALGLIVFFALTISVQADPGREAAELLKHIEDLSNQHSVRMQNFHAGVQSQLRAPNSARLIPADQLAAIKQLVSSQFVQAKFAQQPHAATQQQLNAYLQEQNAARQQAAFKQLNGGAGSSTSPPPNDYSLIRREKTWTAHCCGRFHVWDRRPTRVEIAAKVREFRAGRPTRRHPDTLGWRFWRCIDARLCSPQQGTEWGTSELTAETWSEESAVQGVAGIHAKRLPDNWRLCHAPIPGLSEENSYIVHGTVERFGRYVLGSEGWRAEHVIIRELMAPDPETMLALMRAYPEVKVHLSPYYVAEEV